MPSSVRRLTRQEHVLTATHILNTIFRHGEGLVPYSQHVLQLALAASYASSPRLEVRSPAAGTPPHRALGFVAVGFIVSSLTLSQVGIAQTVNHFLRAAMRSNSDLIMMQVRGTAKGLDSRLLRTLARPGNDAK